MKSLWYRELKRYPAEKSRLELGASGQQLIDRLISANILRRVNSGSEDPSLDELLELAPEEEPMLVFNFCGIILLGDILLHCYPKYILKGDGRASFPLVLKAIERYDRHRRQYLDMARQGQQTGSFLSIIIAILEDYRHNGLYRVSNVEIETNGEGETDWQLTINKHEPFFINADSGYRPVYMNRETTHRRTDKENFFRLVHMAVLDECFELLHKMKLEKIIPPPRAKFRAARLASLGSRAYILSRLKQEYGRQFLESRRSIIRLLIMFLEKKSSRRNRTPVIFYGTNAMNLVWEKALAEVLDNQLEHQVREIEALPIEQRELCEYGDKRLIDLIEHPVWELGGGLGRVVKETLRPDTISLTRDSFLIYDAKYYTPRVGKGRISGQPGLESITKQYLYHMAYKDFLEVFKITKVKNIFIMPEEHEESRGEASRELGKVTFDLLGQYTNTDVGAIYIDADRVWRAYVAGQVLDLACGSSLT